ncbi:MAG: hypothetical protein PHP32_04210, partial [Candidatus Izemoplasmatales bacterium]|nr:hypothetical protein [Candidatus Izemoplasmatales bacterium]
STVYDLSDADLEQTYGITVPELPASVTAALDVYFSTLLQDVYVLGTVNIVMTDHLQDGNFLDSGYSDFTDAELHQMLTDVHDVYYAALFDSYTQN